jgi:ribosome-associated protein
MSMIDQYHEDSLDGEKPSKSARKRESQALQDIGTTIVKLSAGDFAHIPLEGLLQEAILTARRITNHEGLRRQMQYIGKLMRAADTRAIEAALHDLENGRQQHNQHFHQLEKLRDELLAAGVNGMDKVLALYPQADRQHLRQLITAAIKEKEQQKPPAAARKLFRYLRELAEI